jgi:hypothetical protein
MNSENGSTLGHGHTTVHSRRTTTMRTLFGFGRQSMPGITTQQLSEPEDDTMALLPLSDTASAFISLLGRATSSQLDGALFRRADTNYRPHSSTHAILRYEESPAYLSTSFAMQPNMTSRSLMRLSGLLAHAETRWKRNACPLGERQSHLETSPRRNYFRCHQAVTPQIHYRVGVVRHHTRPSPLMRS